MGQYRFILKNCLTPDYGGRLTMNQDISSNVFSFSIDEEKFIDKDTLTFSERKCNISIKGIVDVGEDEISVKNFIDGYKMPMEDMLPFQTLNLNDEIEYDMNNAGEYTSRRVNFLSPIINTNINNNRVVYPASYNPDDGTIHLCPYRQYNEEVYNSYDEQYVVKRPCFYDIVLYVYNEDLLIFTGLLEISGYSYNYKEKKLDMSFTDGNGIAIHCLEKIESIQTYYQGVANSGIKLVDCYNILSKTVYAMYPSLTQHFIFFDADDTQISRTTLYYSINRSSEYATEYQFSIYRGYSSAYLDRILSLNIVLDECYPNENVLFDQEIQFSGDLLDVFLTQYSYSNNGNNAQIGCMMVRYFEAIGGNTICRIYKFYIVLENTIPISGSGWTVSTQTELFSTKADALSYVATTYPNFIFYKTHNMYNAINPIPIEYDFINRPINFYQLPDNEVAAYEMLQNCSNYGFNKQISTLEAIKIYSLSFCKCLFSTGNFTMFRPFQYACRTVIVPKFYCKDINETKEIYEDIDLVSIENITHWKNRKLKENILQIIGLSNQYNILNSYSVSIFNEFIDDIAVGDKIILIDDRVLPSDINIIVTSLKYEKTTREISGYGI